MTPHLLLSFKYLLTFIGQHLASRHTAQIHAAVNYLRVGRWMAEHGYRFSRRVDTRHEVWAAAADQVKLQRVLYLEFGVAAGKSIRHWAGILQHPDSMLHGFDSFEGLPEDGGHWKKGQFSTAGQIPAIADPRVHFFKGWFDQVVPAYSVPPHDVLVINLDADLYSSTIVVLRHLRPHIRKGTLIYFDDMNHPDHEVRAFEDFLNESKLQFVPVCADKSLTHVLFQCVGLPESLTKSRSVGVAPN